ncbi:hypothetical protein ACP70R_045769 [Stipagrostis hirtigluma subsp. patula]
MAVSSISRITPFLNCLFLFFACIQWVFLFFACIYSVLNSHRTPLLSRNSDPYSDSKNIAATVWRTSGVDPSAQRFCGLPMEGASWEREVFPACAPYLASASQRLDNRSAYYADAGATDLLVCKADDSLYFHTPRHEVSSLPENTMPPTVEKRNGS